VAKDFADSVFAHTSTRVRGVSSRRVALGLLLLALGPLLLVLLVAWDVQRRNLVERAENDMAAWASLHVASQEQTLEGTRQMLVTVANTRAVIEADWPTCNAFLQRLADKFPHYVSIGVLTLDGTLACRSTPSSAAINLGDRPYFNAIVRGAPYAMGEYTVGRVTGSKTLPFAYPVRGEQGALVAVGRSWAWTCRCWRCACAPCRCRRGCLPWWRMARARCWPARWAMQVPACRCWTRALRRPCCRATPAHCARWGQTGASTCTM
jgi:hypothetical protein